MGTHAFFDSAFLLTLSDLCGVIKPEHLPGIRRDATAWIRRQCADDSDLETLCAALEGAGSAGDVHSALLDYINRVRESYEQDLQDHDDLQLVFRGICYVVLPVPPEYVTVLRDYDVDMGHAPINTLILRFSMKQCFTLEMTTVGQQLAQSLGVPAIEPSTWTCMS